MVEREESTLQRINRLAEERLELYKKASRQRLSERELLRLDELTRELERLWDQYRREQADRHRLLPQWIAEQEAA
ncbi:MAG: hypothetical protein D6791_10355 [Chloroflexi bacterium]|nr:MAG: hypothetical protein D6791_10355 [Chloroflexota bacterium]